jgi:hypothetical protein
VTSIIYTLRFKRDAKPYKKKFPTFPDTLTSLHEDLLNNPYLGTSLGGNLYKIRVGDESKGAGKSGGFRVITYILEEKKDKIDVYMISIYDKSERSTYTKKELQNILDDCGF